MSGRVRVLLVLGLAIAVAIAALASMGAAAASSQRIVFGHSVQGRPLVALRIGDPASPNKALVVGNIHGDEPAGTAVTRQILRRYRGIGGVDLWVVKTVNPDGLAHRMRKNAHGVDLNRNFSYRWRDGVPPSSGYYPGPHPFSEPESRAVRKLVRQLQPQVSIWFHQPWDQVLAPCHGDASLQRRFSQLSGIPLKRCRGEDLRGTAIDWQQHVLAGTHAFVVELPGTDLLRRGEARRTRRGRGRPARALRRRAPPADPAGTRHPRFRGRRSRAA